MTLLLSNDDVAKLLSVPECMAALEDAYRELAAGRGVNRTRSDCITPIEGMPEARYGLKSMDGVLPKAGVGAIRINSDVITWPKRGNAQRREKVPAANGRWVGLVLVFSSVNGEPLGIMPDGVMQRIRVGSTNGLGVKYMAREDARTLGIIGSGWQAGTQLMAAKTARPNLERVRCYSTTAENRERFSQEMSAELGIDVVPVSSPEEAVKGADIVMCATSSIDPVFFAPWIEKGVHLSSIKQPEIEIAALEKVDRFAIHSDEEKPLLFSTKEVAAPQHLEDKGWSVGSKIDFAKLPLITDLVTGKYQGRTRPEDVTCFLNNIGMGYQFAAAGAIVVRKAKELSVGQEFPTEWFTEDVHP
jgi:ornithine cyclodeaminase/alanine dehydrogenase-like protein (mu-crystallin family)